MATESETLLWRLRLLDHYQLRAIRRRHDWCAIDSFSDKTEFTRRLRDAVDRQVERQQFTYDEFDEYLLKDILRGSGHRTLTRIQTVLGRTTVSDAAPRHDANEQRWFRAQLYGAVQNEFDTPSLTGLPEPLQTDMSYVVEHEHTAFGQSIDIHVTNDRRREEYMIEVKLADDIASPNDLIQQVEAYDRLFDDLEQTVVCFVYKEPSELESLKQHSVDNGALLEQLGRLPEADWVANRVGRTSAYTPAK